VDVDEGDVYRGCDSAAGEGGVSIDVISGAKAVDAKDVPYGVTVMEVELGMKDGGEDMDEMNVVEMTEALERLAAAAERLEQVAEQMVERQIAVAAQAEETVGRIVATVESERERELEQKLAQAEARIVELMAGAAKPVANVEQKSGGRKTLSAGTTSMLAKQGVMVESIDAGAIDGALASLSIEQRIAVKAELLRSGLLG
jgi:F0F1-type ATP synthase membrane subunit b/b'